MESPQSSFPLNPSSHRHLIPLSSELLLSTAQLPLKRTKTICTVGPSSESAEKMKELIEEGMNVARLNFSHGDHESHRQKMLLIQQGMEKSNRGVGILLDTKGPEIRTGMNATKELINLVQGELLEITTDYSHLGTSQKIGCSYVDLATSVKVGSQILIADGTISTVVTEVCADKGFVRVKILNSGSIGSKKNMCLPDTKINLPTIGETDINDIENFGLKYGVDFIAVSFARKLLIEKDPENGKYIQIISKIENSEGIRNIDEIIEGSDGIMVARGDLGMEVPLQKVVLLQKFLINKTISAGKFVITATEMLQSMEKKPRPTRAEVSDVTNSVLDQADANMTSGETANGEFPIESAKFLKTIAEETENFCDYQGIFERRKNSENNREAVGVVGMAFNIGAEAIIIETDSLKLVRGISSLRPKAYTIVFTDNVKVRRALSLDFGVETYAKSEAKELEKFITNNRNVFGFVSGKILEILVENDKIIGNRIHDFK